MAFGLDDDDFMNDGFMDDDFMNNSIDDDLFDDLHENQEMFHTPPVHNDINMITTPSIFQRIGSWFYH